MVSRHWSAEACLSENTFWGLLFNLILLFVLDSRQIYLIGLLSIGQNMPIWASLVAQKIKNLPAVWETWVQSLSWEDPLEKEMATHSSIIA